MIGDFNARTGNLQVIDSCTWIPGMNVKNIRDPRVKVVNVRSKNIVEFINENGFTIPIGRVNGFLTFLETLEVQPKLTLRVY